MTQRLVVVISVVSGCSGSDRAPAASSATSSSMTRLTTTERSPAPSTTEETQDILDLVGFTSPSGNVGCMIDPTFVRCDISERDWTPPPRPADREFDYGQGISMSSGGVAEFVCAGDTALGGGEPLQYGDSVTKGSLTCDSAEEGMSCRDATTGHGFRIAREAYETF